MRDTDGLVSVYEGSAPTSTDVPIHTDWVREIIVSGCLEDDEAGYRPRVLVSINTARGEQAIVLALSAEAALDVAREISTAAMRAMERKLVPYRPASADDPTGTSLN